MKKFLLLMTLSSFLLHAEGPGSSDPKEPEELGELDEAVKADPLLDPHATWAVKSADAQKLYFYDLYKASLHENVERPTILDIKEKYLNPLQLKFSKILAPEVIQIIAAKLSHIDNFYSPLSEHLLRSLMAQLWRLSDLSEMGLEIEKRLRLGNREAHTVFLQKDYLSQMNATNQAAVVLHYAFISLQAATAAYDKSQKVQIGYELNLTTTQETIAYIFSDDLNALGAKGLYHLSQHYYAPSLLAHSPLTSAPRIHIRGFGKTKYKGSTDKSYEETNNTLYLGDIAKFLNEEVGDIAFGDSMCNLARYGARWDSSSITVIIPLQILEVEDNVQFVSNTTHAHKYDLPSGVVRKTTQTTAKVNSSESVSLYKEQTFILTRKTFEGTKCAENAAFEIRKLKKAILADLKYPWIYGL